MQSGSIQNNEFAIDSERMRRDLRYHFMNPKEKWKAKGTLPIKLILIVTKLIIVTIQIILFSDNNSNEVSFVEGSKLSFKHLFLYNWESSFETLPYPPSSGPFAIYKIENFYQTINYALENYYKLEHEAIGPYSYADGNIPVMTLCIVNYRIGEIFPFNHTYQFSQDTFTNCSIIEPIHVNDTYEMYDVKEYLNKKNITIDFSRMLTAYVKFSLRSIQLKSYEMDHSPDCLQFDIQILFNNGNHNGQMLLSLEAEMTSFDCIQNPPDVTLTYFIRNSLLVLDVFALIFSLISFMLCARSLFRLYKFWKKVKLFFLSEINVDVSNKRKHFCGIGYMAILLGDILISCGIIIKFDIHKALKKDIDRFTTCNYFLGLGLFLGHLTLVRYFSYFPKSLILVNTIRVALPSLLRFSVCSTLLYLAFSILGWNILGPYHIKFRSLSSSIACLFSLMLGDDMYVTLSVITQTNTAIFIFSQLFIYFFCVLFIFVVLNLILTIIYEAYEEAEKQESSDCPTDEFWDFINSCPDSWNTSMYKYDLILDKSQSKNRYRYLTHKCLDILCCCIGKANHTAEIKVDDEFQESIEEREIITNYPSTSQPTLRLNRTATQYLRKRNPRRQLNYGSIMNKKISKLSSQVVPINMDLSRNRGFSL